MAGACLKPPSLVSQQGGRAVNGEGKDWGVTGQGGRGSGGGDEVEDSGKAI